eukprot:scaffold8233_cov229-Pinguiococcus_pyrenoidosus.AAC.2
MKQREARSQAKDLPGAPMPGFCGGAAALMVSSPRGGIPIPMFIPMPIASPAVPMLLSDAVFKCVTTAS